MRFVGVLHYFLQWGWKEIMKYSPLNILNRPIEELDFSPEFKVFAKQKQLDTIADFLIEGTRKLDKTDGFSKRMLFEYLQFLEDQDMDEFMES